MSYDVRTADLHADRADILRLWNGNLRDADAVRYRWIYEHNPNGPVGFWVLTDGAGTVAGVAAAFPHAMHGHSARWRAGVTSDFVVGAAHRSVGPALMLQRTLAKSCASRQFDVIVGFANKAARAVQVRAQFTDLGPATDLRKVIRSAAALTRRYGALGRIAAPAADIAIALMERRSTASSGRLRCVETAAFDARFDALWTSVAPAMPLTGERTSAYLNWRFRDHPHNRHRILIAERTDTSALAGYVVWYARENELIIADLLTDGAPDTQRALVTHVLHDARAVGLESVRLRYFGAANRFGALEALGFRASEAGRHVVMFVCPAAAARVPLDRNSWYLLEGDADP